MSESLSTQILAVLLGASQLPKAPKLAAGESFHNSAAGLREYLTDQRGLGLPESNIDWLFDDSRSPTDQLIDIATFLERRIHELKNEGVQVKDLLVYYVGHGLFTRGDQAYCFAVRSTDEKNEGASSIRASDLAAVLKDHAAFLRRFIIIDCCFSGTIHKEFQSGPMSVARVKLQAEFPGRGTTILCSSSARDASLAPPQLSRTMFSDALIKVLREGHPDFGNKFSINELGDAVKERLQREYPEGWIRPEVHSPEQSEGDIADIPLFPNPAYETLLKQNVPVLAVAGAKGGVGKGTFVSCIAQLVADNGYDVAVVDFDLQTAGTTLEALRVHPSLPLVKTVYDHFAPNTTTHSPSFPERSSRLWNITPEYLKLPQAIESSLGELASRSAKRGNIWLLPASDVERTRHGWEVTANIPPVSFINGQERTREEILRSETDAILFRVRSQIPQVRLILIDCGAGKAPEQSAALRCASHRFIVTLPDPSYFPEIHSLRALQVQRYPDDDLDNLYVVANRVTGVADRLRCHNLNPPPVVYIPRDPIAEQDRFAGASIDYDLGYNYLFRAVRDALARTVGLQHPDLVPNEYEARVRPWWEQLVRRGLARKKNRSLNFRLKTYGLWTATGIVCVAFGLFSWRLLRHLMVASGGVLGGDITGVAVTAGALLVAVYYLSSHEIRRRLLARIAKLQPDKMDTESEVLANLLKDLLDEPDRSRLRWLEEIVKGALEKEKIKRTLGRSDSWWTDHLRNG